METVKTQSQISLVPIKYPDQKDNTFSFEIEIEGELVQKIFLSEKDFSKLITRAQMFLPCEVETKEQLKNFYS